MLKKLVITAFVTSLASFMQAQDTISFKNGEKVIAKVLEVEDETVQYKRWTNQDGPTYRKKVEQIEYIRYKSGDVDVYDASMTGLVQKNDSTNELGTNEVQNSVVNASSEGTVEPQPEEKKFGFLRYDKHAQSFVSLDRNHLTTMRAYEVMGDRYDDFNIERKKWKGWKKCLVIGIGVTAVATPIFAVAARKNNSTGLDLATIFVPVVGMASISIGAGMSSKHKRKAFSALGPIMY